MFCFSQEKKMCSNELKVLFYALTCITLKNQKQIMLLNETDKNVTYLSTSTSIWKIQQSSKNIIFYEINQILTLNIKKARELCYLLKTNN